MTVAEKDTTITIVTAALDHPPTRLALGSAQQAGRQAALRGEEEPVPSLRGWVPNPYKWFGSPCPRSSNVDSLLHS